MDPNKVHTSLLRTLQELEKEDPCKNYFLYSTTSPDPNGRKESSRFACMKEDEDFMSNQGEGQKMESIGEERSTNVSRHHYENFKTKEDVFNHLHPNEKEREISKSQETTKQMINDEENVDQGEFHTTLFLLGAWMLQMMTSYVEKIFPIILP